MCRDAERLPGPPSDLDLLFFKKEFSRLYQTLRGFFTKSDLVLDLLGNNNSIDILTLSETHVRPTDEVSVLNVTRKIDTGDGVGICLSNQHDFKCHEDFKNANLESI